MHSLLQCLNEPMYAMCVEKGSYKKVLQLFQKRLLILRLDLQPSVLRLDVRYIVTDGLRMSAFSAAVKFINIVH